MKIIKLTPRKALNKAFLKVKPIRSEIDTFKKNFVTLLDSINPEESEEFHKNLAAEFLRKTYYNNIFFINTSGNIDLVIHMGKEASTPVGALMEFKRPQNKEEMISTDNLNAKAFHELILYYLRQRISKKNIQIRRLIITNIYEWYIFDANAFERIFASDKTFVKSFIDFEEDRLSGTSTDFFYNEVAKLFIDKLDSDIAFAYFDIRDYEKHLRKDNDKESDIELIALYKLLSPEHILKLPSLNDNNTLDTQFYSELLHIIGLTETSDNGKKLIQRNKVSNRNSASLIENAITQIQALDKLSRFHYPQQFGENEEERLFNIGLELAITWINRILFLKLLETQLINYNMGNKSYAFLNLDRIASFGELNNLFFSVLARKPKERSEGFKGFDKIPYLNSSLFEPTGIEQSFVFISQLLDRELPIFASTVLKDSMGRKRKGNIKILEYLFSFLDAYDFSSEGSEDIQVDKKTLINASVLGLIYEKINGYKEGSFFTPGSITMYMCRETIREAIIKRFNEEYGWQCESLADIYNKIGRNIDIDAANKLINSIRICDPAVGSGHFLVSALNEIIAIKGELGVLVDKEKRRLRDYNIEVVNDELIITEEADKFFSYNPKNKESQRVQEALFLEKKTIIENCLFGVDINPNSVNICRLRLWIELLKHSYYTQESGFKELETLPNIDINIKCGNSLISRYPLDVDVKQVLRRRKMTTSDYCDAVMSYRNATSREEKKKMFDLIHSIKSDFISEILASDPKRKKLSKLKGELDYLNNQMIFFPMNEAEKAKREERITKLFSEVRKLEEEINGVKSNRIYQNAFEWRFEFPEALDNNGDFKGFDVVIGNPPYISHDKITERAVLQTLYECYEPFADYYCYFIELALELQNHRGIICLITSNSYLKANYGLPIRRILRKDNIISQLINIEDFQVFEKAIVNTAIILSQKKDPKVINKKCLVVNGVYSEDLPFQQFVKANKFFYSQKEFETEPWLLLPQSSLRLKRKIEKAGPTLEQYNARIRLGLATGNNKAFIIDEDKRERLIKASAKNAEIIKPILRGRDIQRYYYNSKEYIILSKNEINIKKEYPSIYKHFEAYGPEFKSRGAQGSHWTNLRACAFYDDFKLEKIIWIELSDKARFALCLEEIYLLNTAYFLIPPKEIAAKYLLAILNSKLIEFYLKIIAETSGMGTVRWINNSVKEFPIPKASKKAQQPFITLVKKILALTGSKDYLNNKKKQDKVKEYDRKIDELVYKLYNLTPQEIKIIEEHNKKFSKKSIQ